MDSNRTTNLLAVMLVLGALAVSVVGGFMIDAMGDLERAVQTQAEDVQPKDVKEEVVQLRNTLEIARGDADIVMSVMEKSDTAVVGLDQSGRIILWSTGAEKLFGTPRTEAMGYGIAFLIPDGMRKDHRDKFEAAMRSRDTTVQQYIECNAQHSDGTEVPVSITPMHLPLCCFSLPQTPSEMTSS